ncbi:MAG: phosphate acyltransferase PlsX [Phycisphaerales bacterium JB039]
MRLAIDVMGGDHAPDAILAGCIDALAHLKADDRLILVGDEAVIRETLCERSAPSDRIEIVHAPQVIGMHEPPARAVRAKPDSSIVELARLGSPRGGQVADAVLSAGNTGACVSAAIMHMKRLPQVHRPGIAVTIPAFHGPVVLCDAGANPEPRATHLWQYGVMAETYARRVLGIERPRVAQMNIGSEEAKGTGIIKQTRDLLRATPDLNYIGYIEGRDFFDGAADVVVTDGFVGNTVLKMAEGLAKSLFNAIAHEIFAIDPELALKFEPVVKQIYAKNDYHEHGGAPLLGVNGAFFIAHGSSQSRTICAAIRNALEYISAHVNEAVVARLAEVAPVEEELHAAHEGEPA